MNYRHAFHAGNFADVIKHAVLARILLHLCAKPAAFRVIDTHAGAGLYDLAGEEAGRSGEWRAGIGRLLAASIAPSVRTLLAPYLDVVASFNEAGGLERLKRKQSGDPVVPANAETHGNRSSHGSKFRPGSRLRGNERIESKPTATGYSLATYPGSPALARAFLRPQDRLIACELEPRAAAALARNFERDRRIKTIAIDGWIALNAYVPPPERRGVVVVDPPFEDARDFSRLALGLGTVHRKWAGGIYLLWYPIKSRQEPDSLTGALKRSGIARVLRVELVVGPPPAQGSLGGCGLIVVNPPWTLAGELAAMLPELAAILGGPGGRHRLDWITGEIAVSPLFHRSRLD